MYAEHFTTTYDNSITLKMNCILIKLWRSSPRVSAEGAKQMLISQAKGQSVLFKEWVPYVLLSVQVHRLFYFQPFTVSYQ